MESMKYEMVTDEQKRQAVDNRIREIEQSMFLVEMQLIEMREIAKAVTLVEDKAQAEKEISGLEVGMLSHRQRLVALKRMRTSFLDRNEPEAMPAQ